MVEVPTLEQQKANEQFRYDKIILVLFSQTKFDNVQKKFPRKSVPKPFQEDTLAMFHVMKADEQIKTYSTIPQRLLDLIFNNFQLEHEMKTRSHDHTLKRRKGIHQREAVDGVTWTCDNMIGGKGCLHATDEQWRTKDQEIPGWICEECVQHDSKGFAICEKCLTCEQQIETLINWLKDDDARAIIEAKIQLYNLQENREIDSYKQAYADVPNADHDCEIAKRTFLTQYLVKPEDIIEMKNMTIKQCNAAYRDLKRQLTDDADIKHLVVHVCAGHGVQYEGYQSLLTNEWDKKSCFYNRFTVEKNIRTIAQLTVNSYHVGIFACCREAETKKYEFVSKVFVDAYNEEKAVSILHRTITKEKRFLAAESVDSDEEKIDFDKELLRPETLKKLGITVDHSSTMLNEMSLVRQASQKSVKSAKSAKSEKSELSEKSRAGSRKSARRPSQINNIYDQPNFDPVKQRIVQMNQSAEADQAHPTVTEERKASRGGEDSQEEGESGMKELGLHTQSDNCCLVFGTPPSKQVDIDTKMVKNLLDHLKTEMHKVEHFVEFPSVLNCIEGDDAKFELSISNSVQRCRLYSRASVYKPAFENIVGNSMGVIVVNTCVQDQEYEPEGNIEYGDDQTVIAKQVSETKDFYTSLGITPNSVKVLEDQPKDAIINYFESLVQTSEYNERQEEEKKTLAILVRWIGFDCTPTPKYHRSDIIKRGSKYVRINTMVEYEKEHKPMNMKLDHYGITCRGEPISVEAFCTRLASQSRTHVMLIQDLVYQNEEVEEQNINIETVFNEPHFSNESDFNRFCLFRTAPGLISKQFGLFQEYSKRMRAVGARQVFLFPDHFNGSAFNSCNFSQKGEWMLKSSFNEQIVFDLRSDQQKALQKQQKTERAFKVKFEIWEDRPRIVRSKEFKYNDYNKMVLSSSVHHLSAQELILLIEAGYQISQDSSEKTNQVIFEFFEHSDPFEKIKYDESEYSEEDYILTFKNSGTKAQLVKDLRSEDENYINRLLVIIDDLEFGEEDHVIHQTLLDQNESQPLSKQQTSISDDTINIVELNYDKDDDCRKYKKPRIMKTLKHSFSTIAAYLMQDDQLLLVTKSETFVIDTKYSVEWRILSQCNHQQLIHDQFKGQISYSCQPDFLLRERGTGNGFLRTFDNRNYQTLPDEVTSYHANISPHKLQEERTPQQDQVDYSFLARFTYKYEEKPTGLAVYSQPKGNLVLNNPKRESIFFQEETCWSAFEYAPGMMLVSTKHHIYNLKKWKVIRVYKNADIGSFDKMGFFLPFPGFSLNKFPFVIVSSKKNIKIINVNDDYMEPFIKTKQTVTYGQEAFFFMKSQFGMILNFTTGRQMYNGKKRLEWVAMDLKQEFSNTLEQAKRLPCNTAKDLIETQTENFGWREKKRIRDSLPEDPLVIELRETNQHLEDQKKQLNEERKQFQLVLKQQEKKRLQDVKEEANKFRRELKANETQIFWQQEEVLNSKKEVEEVKQTIGKLEAEIDKLKKSKATYKSALMDNDRFKPCLAMVNNQRRITRKVIAQIGAQNRDIMVQTLHQSPSRRTIDSAKKLIGVDSVQFLDEPADNFLTTLPDIQQSEETMLQRQHILKTIKNSSLFEIHGGVTRQQQNRPFQGLQPGQQLKTKSIDPRKTKDNSFPRESVVNTQYRTSLPSPGRVANTDFGYFSPKNGKHLL